MNFGGTLRLNKFACFTLIFLMFLIIYWRCGSAEYPTEKSDLINIKSLLKAAIIAAERGGKKVIDGKSKDLNIKSKGKTQEGANDPVTDADYASHCAMFYGLKTTFPKLVIISEEHADDDLSCHNQEGIDIEASHPEYRSVEYLNDEHVFVKDVVVWIDPLDATQEYTEGLHQYVTTMVCVAINGVPIVGVIHYPFPPRTYWGWYTKKTSSNIPHIDHNEDNKNHPRVVISRSHTGTVADLAKNSFGDQTIVTKAGGAGDKIMGVVNGTFDVYLHATAIKKWDLCAGNAILKTVEGKLTTLKGEEISYSQTSGAVLKDGLLATRYDHDFYLSKLPKTQSDKT